MTHIKTCVVVLIIAMVLSLVLVYANIMTVITTTKGNTERVLDSFVVENSIMIYNSIKNGDDFTRRIDAAHFSDEFFLDCTFDKDAGFFYNIGEDGEIVYKLTIPQTSFTVTNTLNLTCKLNVIFPIYFAGKQVSQLTIPLTVKSNYTLKYD